MKQVGRTSQLHTVPFALQFDSRKKQSVVRRDRKEEDSRCEPCWLKVFSECCATERRESLPPLPRLSGHRRTLIAGIRITVLSLTQNPQAYSQQKQVNSLKNVFTV